MVVVARARVTDVQPHYLGVAGMEVSVANVATRARARAALANRGSMFAFSDGRSIMAQALGNGGMRVYFFGKQPEAWSWDCGYDVADPDAVRAGLLRKYAGWDPQLTAFA